MILKNTPISSLDEIKRSIPTYWLDFDDYMAIQRFVADEMDDFAVSALKIIDNFFVFRADDDTITDIQKFIGVYDIQERIVDRNIYINGVLTAIGKLSVSKLTRWIEGVLGERPNIYFEPDDSGNRIMHIEVGNHPELLNDLIILITQRLPAHITVVSESRENMPDTVMNYGTGVMFETGYETIPINEDIYEQGSPADLSSELNIGVPLLEKGFITLEATRYATYGAVKTKTYGQLRHKTYADILLGKED